MAMQDAVSSTTRVPRPGKKYFDVDEANRAIGYVSRIVRDLRACYRHVVDIRRRIEHPHSGGTQEHLEAQYETGMEELSSLVDELHQVGVELKDFEEGLIDFPSINEGREVYLCWQPGEERVISWHEIDAGFAGRQSIDLLKVSAKKDN